MIYRLVDGRIFYWINYQTIIDELPILGIKNRRVIARHFDKLEKSGVLFFKVEDQEHECFLDGKSIIRKGTYTYFSFNSEKIDTLQRKKENNSTDVRVDSKVHPGCTEKNIPPVLKSTDKDSFTRDSSTNDFYLIVNGCNEDINFRKSFEDFLVDDSLQGRQNLFFWVNHNAEKYESTLPEVIFALNKCNEKNRQGEMDYLTGILRNKAEARDALS